MWSTLGSAGLDGQTASLASVLRLHCVFDEYQRVQSDEDQRSHWNSVSVARSELWTPLSVRIQEAVDRLKPVNTQGQSSLQETINNN